MSINISKNKKYQVSLIFFSHNTEVASYLQTDRWNGTSRHWVAFLIHLKGVVSLPKHHVIQVFGEMGVKIYKFLTSTQDRSELLASLFKHFITGNIAPDTHWIDVLWADSKTSLGICQRSISAPIWNVSPFVQSVASHFTDWTIPATHFLYLSALNVDNSSIEMIWQIKWRIILYMISWEGYERRWSQPIIK